MRTHYTVTGPTCEHSSWRHHSTPWDEQQGTKHGSETLCATHEETAEIPTTTRVQNMHQNDNTSLLRSTKWYKARFRQIVHKART